MNKARRFAIVILAFGAIFTLVAFTGVISLNRTPSVPTGLWRASYGPIARGDYVVIDVKAFAAYDTYRDYLSTRRQGQSTRFLKKVAAMESDTITIDGEGILVNGERLPDSLPLSQDRAGNKLVAYPLPITMEKDQVWLSSHSPRGIDSRYLGYADLRRCKKVVPLWLF